MTRAKPIPVEDIKALEGDEKPPLNWDGGRRAPPSNRGAGEASTPSGREFANGDRGEAGGRNQEQQAQVSGTPGKRP